MSDQRVGKQTKAKSEEYRVKLDRLRVKEEVVRILLLHSLNQQDNFIGAVPKSYRLEVHPRNTIASNECPSRVIIGDCRLLHFGGLFLSRTQCSRHGVLCTGVRECQPQCRNRKHKLIQQRLMLSSEYHTHAVKTEKGRLQCTRSKMGRDKLQNKRDWKEKETKYNRLELTSNPVFAGLEKLQRYITKTILYKKKLISLRRSPNSNWLDT